MDWLLGFLLVVFPPAAGLLVLIRAVQLKAWQYAGRTWWFIWSPFAALALAQTSMGKLQEAADLGVFALLGFAAGLVGNPVFRKRMLSGILAGLPILFLFVAIDAYSPYFTWQVKRAEDKISNVPFNWLPLRQRVDSTQSRVEIQRFVASRSAHKYTSLMVQGTKTGEFYLSHPGIDVVQSSASTRFEFPSHQFSSAYKAFRIRSPADDAPVRLRLELRAPSGLIAPEGCRGPSIRTFNASGEELSSCQPSEVDTDWRALTRTWTPPGHWDQHYVWAGFFDFGGHSLEVRNMQVEQYVAGSWMPLEEVENLLVRLSDGSGEDGSEWREITSKWMALRIPVSASKHGGHAHMSVPLGAELNLVTSLSAARMGLLPAKRAQAWFSHPNLLAHTALALLLLAFAWKPSPTVAAASSGLLLAVIVLTGSRIANVIGFLAVGALIFQMFRTFYARILIVIVAASWLTILLNAFPRLSPAAILGGVNENAASRSEIWAVAWRAMVNNPLAGIGSGFADFFGAIWNGPAFGVANHAHNFWLHMGASYGVFAFVAAITLAISLLVIVGRSRCFVAVVAVPAIVLLNWFDVTLITPGVLIPTSMITGLACSRCSSVKRV